MINFNNIKVINIEPTNYCNYRCSYCGDLKIRPQGFMDLRLMDKIIDQCVGLHFEARLFLSGEPLFHREIGTLIKKARKVTNEVLIHTNASVLTEEVANTIIEAGLTKISFSIHKKSVIKNIKNFIRINHGRVHTTWQEIVSYPQELKPSAMIDGIDKYYIRHPHNWDVDGSVKTAKPHKGGCCFINSYMAIQWDGKAVACCADLNGKYIVGDAGRESLKSIWNGEKLSGIRERMKYGLPIPELCSKCERYGK